MDKLIGKRAAGLAFLLCSLLVAQTGLALPVTGLYEQRIAVANESDAERGRAFREALQAVILKVTGDRRWLDHPAVQQAVNNAQQYVEAIGYDSGDVPIPEEELEMFLAEREAALAEADDPDFEPPPVQTTREQRFIRVDFAASLIDRMLTNADIPVWDDNRPSVLVWMVLQDAGGQRSMLTEDSNPEIMALMDEFAERRGLPIIFPVLDFADRQSLNENQVWALDEEAIRRASQRYDADSILAARLHFTASGELVGLWQFIFQDEVQVFDGFAPDLQAYLLPPLDRITVQLANYFAIAPVPTSQPQVHLRVDGVSDLEAYTALLGYVRNLALVGSVEITGLDGTRLELQLNLVGGIRQLNELISLDRDLAPVTAIGARDAGILHYRWTR